MSHNAILNLLDSKKLIAVGHLHCHFDEYSDIAVLFKLNFSFKLTGALYNAVFR